MKIKKVTKMWKTKNGEKIRICDMSDSHLNNTIAMLERKAEDLHNITLESYPNFQGEMAQYYAEQEWEQVAKEGCDAADIYPIYSDLLDERMRRDLLKKN